MTRAMAPARRTWRGLAVSGLLVGLLVAGAGCRASTQDVVTYAGQLPRPAVVLVHDFTSMPGEARLDSGIVGRLREETQGTSLTEQQVALRQRVTAIMTTQLVQEIGKLGMPARPASLPTAVEGPTLAIEGQFLTIDEGNRTRRLVIGLGAGASQVRVAVQVLQTIGGQERLVEDFYTNARSSRKPGVGPMAGAGAARAGAGTSTGIGLGTDALMGPQDAEGDTRQAAVAITKELARFFATQGWISTEQADRYQLIP